MTNKKKNNLSNGGSRRSFVQKTALATSALLTMPLGVDAMANVYGAKKLVFVSKKLEDVIPFKRKRNA